MRTNPKHAQVYHTTMTASYRAEHGLGPEVVLNQALGDECLVFKVRKSSISVFVHVTINQLTKPTNRTHTYTHTHAQHLLPLTAARAPGWRAWLPLAFNMETEAAAFVHEFRQDPRLFILKPWNMGRSMDTAVVDSLPQAQALALTCPKVACEYVRDTALVYSKKIDVRCVVAVV